MKKIIISFFIFLTLFPSGFVFAKEDKNQLENIEIEEEEVVYNLPYPGILPDHPLYFLKSIRDNVLIFITRDNERKSKLFLTISDKKMASALALAEKGRGNLSQKELEEGEDLFLKIPKRLSIVKEQGGSYSPELIQNLYLSNKKHRETITEVMKKNTESETNEISELLKKNTEIKNELDKLEK